MSSKHGDASVGFGGTGKDMAAQQRANGSLGDQLTARRLHRFVGREAEVEPFRAALAASEPPFAALYLHGPGGIGKTSLLRMLAVIAEETGAAVVHLDGHDIISQPTVILDALRRSPVVEVGDGDALISAASNRRLALLIDSYDRLATLDAWVRGELLPRLPRDAVTVIASRSPPDRGGESIRPGAICCGSSRCATWNPTPAAGISRSAASTPIYTNG